MASFITAGNATNGLQVSSDNTGILELKSGTGSGTTAVTIGATQNVGIGTSSPSTKLHVAGNNNGILISAASGTATALYIAGNGNTVGVGSFDVYQDGSNNAVIYQRANAPLITFVNGAERMRIDSSGNVLVTSAQGLGYGTGSGGTVTQATNKATAVTLNKPTGQITMSNAALAAGASANFAVNNSLVSSTDIVVLSVGSTGFGGSYTVVPLYCTTGQFGVRLTNTAGSSLSEAVVVNFAIIKGATA